MKRKSWMGCMADNEIRFMIAFGAEGKHVDMIGRIPFASSVWKYREVVRYPVRQADHVKKTIGRAIRKWRREG